MAKAPVPGRVKTRLCPPCSPHQAAAIAEAALADTLDSVAQCRADARILALDGTPGDWLPHGFDVIPQRGVGLADRLANAWADAAGFTAGWGVQIGMDTPQVRSEQLDDILDLMSCGDDRTAVLGPATDGGWWVIGLPGTNPGAAFTGVPMSTPLTGQFQRERLRRLGLAVMTVPTLTDIDTMDDLLAVAAGIPGSRTAAVAGSIRRAVA